MARKQDKIGHFPKKQDKIGFCQKKKDKIGLNRVLTPCIWKIFLSLESLCIDRNYFQL